MNVHATRQCNVCRSLFDRGVEGWNGKWGDTDVHLCSSCWDSMVETVVDYFDGNVGKTE